MLGDFMRRASQGYASIEAYWRNSEIRDTFWQITFPRFIEPLAPVFIDPSFAGAALLSAFTAAPTTLRETFTKRPDRFGRLRSDAYRLDVVFDQIADQSGVSSLEHCAKSFIQAQQAVKRLDAFAKAEPVLFRDLQRKRSALDGKSFSPRPPRAYSLNLKF
jgi:hypothetical protein